MGLLLRYAAVGAQAALANCNAMQMASQAQQWANLANRGLTHEAVAQALQVLLDPVSSKHSLPLPLHVTLHLHDVHAQATSQAGRKIKFDFSIHCSLTPRPPHHYRPLPLLHSSTALTLQNAAG